MSEEDFGVLCQRFGCEHTRASHLGVSCDWCSCRHFLEPGHDDEAGQRMTQSPSEFERGYAERSGVSVEWLREHGRVVRPCYCDEYPTVHWQSVNLESWQGTNP